MKNSIFILIFGAFMIFGTSQNLFATNPISPEAQSTLSLEVESNAHVLAIEKQGTRIGKFFQKIKKGAKKFSQKVKTAFYKVGGMFDDPVKKWLWFWILSALAAAILYAIGVAIGFGGGFGAATALLYIGIAFSLFSSIAFIVWIVKLVSQ